MNPISTGMMFLHQGSLRHGILRLLEHEYSHRIVWTESFYETSEATRMDHQLENRGIKTRQSVPHDA